MIVCIYSNQSTPGNLGRSIEQMSQFVRKIPKSTGVRMHHTGTRSLGSVHGYRYRYLSKGKNHLVHCLMSNSVNYSPCLCYKDDRMSDSDFMLYGTISFFVAGFGTMGILGAISAWCDDGSLKDGY